MMAAALVNFSFSEDDLEKVKVSDAYGRNKGKDLKEVIQKRRGKRSAITKCVNNVHNCLQNLSESECRNSDSKLQRLRSEVVDLENVFISLAIASDIYSESELDTLMEINEMYQDKIEAARIAIDSRLASLNVGLSSITTADSTKAKLPKVDLPYFSGAIDEFDRFMTTFDTLISKHGLTSYEKYIYLKGQLSGSPRLLIDSLPLNSLTYEAAKKLLNEAYCDKTLQQYKVIEKLARLKLTNDGNTYQWMSSVRTIVDQVKTLGIDVTLVMQYFIWHSLNEKFQQQYIAITNNSKPNYQEIIDNMFEANSRYLAQSDNLRKKKDIVHSRSNDLSKPSVVSLAMDIPTKRLSTGSYKPCKLCKVDSVMPEHSITRCPKYQSSSDKIKRLLELDGCVRCSSLKHQKQNCSTKFEIRCKHCKRWHLEILCEGLGTHREKGQSKEGQSKKGQSNEDNSREKSKNVNECKNGLTLGFMNEINVGNDMLLPTLLGNLESNGLKEKIVLMYDCCSQLSFVSSDLAEKFRMPVVRENFSVDVNGFNSISRYNTKTVKVSVLLNGEIVEFEAVCVPTIRTSLSIKRVNTIAESFRERGYQLANNELDQNPEISVIIGVSTTRILNAKTVVYGNKSSYLDSRFGVIPLGSVTDMLKDMHCLQRVNCNVNEAHKFEDKPDADAESDDNNDNVFDKVALFYTSVSSDSSLIDFKDEIRERELEFAANDVLELACSSFLNIDKESHEYPETYLNIDLCNFTLEHTVKDSESGRLVIPLPWDPKVIHMMDDNFQLSKKILDHNVRKLKKNHEKLQQYNAVIDQQESDGIIERIPDLETFLKENAGGISFLAHNGVFRPGHESTKCRIVFLSNLKGDQKLLSHNQCSLPGPNLNHKLTTALTLLRFDKFLITFDLKQAFLQILLRKEDTSKLLFLWYSDVMGSAESLVAYRFLRLPFGLRFSPFILMIALYVILVLANDDENGMQLRKELYDLTYMDNIAWTTNTEECLQSAYDKFESIFGEFQFKLQQFHTNYGVLQTDIDRDFSTESNNECKLFGMIWIKDKDTLRVRNLKLDGEANTKRLILRTLQSVFDVFGICLPILNRARLFMHRLQVIKDLDWDTHLSRELLREWGNIAKQVNNSPVIEVPRSFGNRKDTYDLLCFTDASKSLYGCVVYLRNVITGEITFLHAKNRVINEQLKEKTMPVLELVAIHFGVESLMDYFKELQNAFRPIRVNSLKVYTDSTISLSWIVSLVSEQDKMRGRSIFVMNKLQSIRKICNVHPVEFYHISGASNPADMTTREVSGKLLTKTNFHVGPSALLEENFECKVLVPNPIENLRDSNVSDCLVAVNRGTEPIFPLNKFSSFYKAVTVLKYCFRFIDRLKVRIKAKYVEKYAHLEVFDHSEQSLYRKSISCLIHESQSSSFPEIIRYFEKGAKRPKNIPELASKLNLFLDENGLIRVKSKMDRLNAAFDEKYPILLASNSPITTAIIWDMHIRKGHGGVYNLLNELRREFWILKYYSTVSKVLKDCLWCKRLNARTIKTNTSPYRYFRVEPNSVPFRDIMIDHFGPFTVKLGEEKKKVWILIVTCLYSRAVSLNLCQSLDTDSFLKAFQLHIFKQGMPKLIISDPGSSLVSGVNTVTDFLNDFETANYLESHGITNVKFQTYPSGASWLGGLVESMVKQSKKLLYSSIHNRILDYVDFEHVIAETECLINKRPVAFKDSLRSSDSDVCALTPELILKGYENTILNVIPQLQSCPDLNSDKDWIADNDECVGPKGRLFRRYEKLKKVREQIKENYHGEFLRGLIQQAVDRKGRYSPVSHTTLDVGDLVCIKQPFAKPLQYPMGIVKSVEFNDLGETVSARIQKGNKQIVHKHPNDLIFLSKGNNDVSVKDKPMHPEPKRIQPKRKAKSKANQKLAKDAGLSTI